MSSKPDKATRPKARLARGFADRGQGEIAATERMLAAIRETFERYGFSALETPFIEYTDVLGKFLPDLDRPNEGVFSFRDDDEQWLSLRYDLTAPLARHVAENFDQLPKPFRSYRAGWVFRNEKPGPGRFRQFMQFDADTVGASSIAADAEMCMMAADTMEHLGIERGNYVIKVNSRKVLDGLMEVAGIGGEGNAARRLIVLRAIDKLDRLGLEGVTQLLGPGRKDESGDFTTGAQLGNRQIDTLIGFVGDPMAAASSARGIANKATVANFQALVGSSPSGLEGSRELEGLAELIEAAGYGDGRVRIDPSVVRGLEYYTGPVYEAELTFEVKDERGRPMRFGSVGGGGRYDGLVGRFRGEDVPATGFSIGVSRLFAALKAINSPLVSSEQGLPLVVVTVMDQERVADYQRMAAELRALTDAKGAAVVRAEVYLGEGRFGAQMKYADRRGAVCAIIQGSEEKSRGDVTVKDLMLGAELAGLGKDRSDYKQKQAEAQFSVPQEQLGSAVRDIIAKHAKS